jgi:alkylated DNA repair dioxygenase AlkB
MIASNFDLIRPELPDADIRYYPNFIKYQDATALLDRLLYETDWKEESITLFGKKYKQPRLTAWYGEEQMNYSYSGINMVALPFTPTLLKIRSLVECFTNETFNSVLLNLYRDGDDSNGWHSDDEKELGKDPVIASLSLGAVRKFKLKYRLDSTIRYDISLGHGSLLLMKAETQHFWKHQIPKSKKVDQARINLTFRRLIP